MVQNFPKFFKKVFYNFSKILCFESNLFFFSELSRTEQKKLNEALLKAVAGYHSETLGWTEGGDLDEIEQLIEQGASLDYVDENGNNAYHEACNKGQLESELSFYKMIFTLMSHRMPAGLLSRGSKPAKQIQSNCC